MLWWRTNCFGAFLVIHNRPDLAVQVSIKPMFRHHQESLLIFKDQDDNHTVSKIE